MEKVSVCLASYNGEKYILQQVFSILEQLNEFGELIVVDDCSTDKTTDLLYSIKDNRVKVYVNRENLGHVKTFENAILKAQGDFIFLSDQDDIWIPGRLSMMLSELKSGEKSVVATNFYLFDDNIELATQNKKRLPSSCSRSKIALLIFLGVIPYFGCAMAFKRSVKGILLPFPSYVESHDLWLAFVGIFEGGISHVECESLYHRVHGSNLTPKRRRSLAKVAKTRFYFLLLLSCVFLRKYKARSFAGDE